VPLCGKRRLPGLVWFAREQSSRRGRCSQSTRRSSHRLVLATLAPVHRPPPAPPAARAASHQQDRDDARAARPQFAATCPGDHGRRPPPATRQPAVVSQTEFKRQRSQGRNSKDGSRLYCLRIHC
jgi:hypothetical protein